ncbi:glycosyltransferase family 4 protein [Rhodococcus sp. UFZ-B548]|uniref:glycosyltransferase family 4 protein n=1 Tax=Rhodococcus sp. UFZ-B548 TaxID=2742212 RepID=UPI0015F7524D|nr:glycosyltransferase family 4 protein [Rhodococcus sp. UFZ-B548]
MALDIEAKILRRVSNRVGQEMERLRGGTRRFGRPISSSASILGYWELDAVEEPEISTPPGILTISGWAASEDESVDVAVRLSGKLLALAVPILYRPDVAEAVGDFAAKSGWSFDLEVSPSWAGEVLEVVAVTARSRRSFGRWTIRVLPTEDSGDQCETDVVVIDGGDDLLVSGVVEDVEVRDGSLDEPCSGAVIAGPVVEDVVVVDGGDLLVSGAVEDVAVTDGSVDEPCSGAVIAGPVVQVNGWVVIDGQAADVIEICIDDQPPIRARRCDPRPDLVDAVVAQDFGAGYYELVAIRGTAATDQITLKVRAVGRSGKIWNSTPVTFTVVQPAQPAELPKAAFARDFEVPVREPSVRPRICIFTHSLSIGGAELYLEELLLRLTAAGVADFMVICPEDGVMRTALEEAGIAVHIGSDPPSDARRYVDRVAELSSVLLAWRCDVVMVNTMGQFIGVEAASALGLPSVWVIHESFGIDVFNRLLWGDRRAEMPEEVVERLRVALTTADAVIFESEATREMLQQMEPAARTRCIRYGIELDKITQYEQTHDRDAIRRAFGFSPADRVLLCMGTLTERKAQIPLVNEFATVLDEFPNAKLVLVGYVPTAYGIAVKRRVAELGIEDSVHVIDVDPDHYRWYACADILVNASDSESLPRTFLEGMAFGLPILATDIFGTAEVVSDGSTGWLFEPRCGSQLREGLCRALECSETELSEMSAQSRSASRSFDGQGYATEYKDLFLELVRR